MSDKLPKTKAFSHQITLISCAVQSLPAEEGDNGRIRIDKMKIHKVMPGEKAQILERREG